MYMYIWLILWGFLLEKKTLKYGHPPKDSHNSSCCHGLHFLIFSSDVRDSNVATFCFWIICDYLEVPNPEDFL